MLNQVSQHQRNTTKIVVFPTFDVVANNAAANNSTTEIKTADKEKNFKELVEDYSFLGKRMKHLTKDEQYKICLAYIEHKYSSWPFNKEVSPSEEVDVPLDIETLRLLKQLIAGFI